MTNEAINKIRELALKNGQINYDCCSESLLSVTEESMGMVFPEILRECYLRVGNGGFGPGLGLIGLKGGSVSDFGTLIETYHQLKGDKESEGDEWPDDVVPFFHYGCNIFTCIECNVDSDPDIYVFEDFELWEQEYSLNEFVEMWLRGKMFSPTANLWEKRLKSSIPSRAKSQKCSVLDVPRGSGKV